MRQLGTQGQDQANQLLAQNNSPQLVDAQASQAADALYAVGGFNPATALNQAGAAFGAAAAARPGQAQSTGTLLSSAGLMQAGSEAENAYRQQLAQIGSERARLTTEIASDLQRADMDRAQFAETKKQRELAQQNADRDFQLALAKFEEDQRQFGLAYAMDQMKAAQPDLQIVGSDSAGRFAWDPATGQIVPVLPPVSATASGKPKLDAKERRRLMADAAASARDGFWGVKNDDGSWLVEPRTYQQTITDLLSSGVPLEIAQSAVNRWWKRPGYEADVEARKQGKIVWDRSVKGAGRPKVPYQQRVGKGKAGAAAETAAYVTKSPSADRAGYATNPAVIDFVGRVGQLAGRRLTIGTGTRHNRYVIGTTRESAHWQGNAADIPASGATLTRIGQAALIAAGMPPEQAQKIRGGLFNIGNYQVIFNTNEGGNHFNHLHIGLRGQV